MKCLTPRITKFLLFALNLVIAVGGIVSIAYGIEYLHNEKGVHIFGDLSFGALSVTCGAIVLVTAIFGCLAVIFTKTIFLTIYSAILMLLFPFKLSLGIMAVTKVENYDFFLHEIKKILIRFFETDTSKFYNVQSEFQCCGVDDYTEYVSGFPSTCCQNKPTICLLPFENGCAGTVALKLENYIQIIGCVAIVFTIIELMSAFIALALSKNRQQMSDILFEKFEGDEPY